MKNDIHISTNDLMAARKSLEIATEVKLDEFLEYQDNFEARLVYLNLQLTHCLDNAHRKEFSSVEQQYFHAAADWTENKSQEIFTQRLEQYKNMSLADRIDDPHAHNGGFLIGLRGLVWSKERKN